ncbi:phytoene desaturase family protein [Pollutibacter soli]|uniref:phytoene desaturase family protein n=1 Tax=Pollutibacter soli TaxID=3034157 RepID=UPI003013A0F9
MPRKVVVIGSGFAGLSAAAFMAKAGWQVQVLEKHDQAGGRARRLSAEGFHFDMGPSWYWMPDVFERFFNQFGKKVSDQYELKRLDPSYRIYFDDGPVDIPANPEKFKSYLESIEKGAAAQLDKFLNEAAYKYQVGMQELVFRPGLSIMELLDWKIIRNIFRIDIFSSITKHIESHFQHPKIKQILSFPVLFLGSLPEHTPALYSLMNYADLTLGTWYPMGGMYRIVEAMKAVAEEQGAQFVFNTEARKINIENGSVKSVIASDGKEFFADVVIGGADYHFIETQLLPEKSRSYSRQYWESRKMAPSCLLYYIGLNRKVPGLQHHSLFFDADFTIHARDIYENPSWPTHPLFYVSNVTATDPEQAPEGFDNIFILIPVAAGLDGDDITLREKYFDIVSERFKHHTGFDLKNHIVLKKTFGPSDFVNEYHAYKGNAYGLANTLMQTANLKPSCRSKKVKNLFYTGQLTVPGPGVPPALISGEIVAKEVIRCFG